MNIKEISKIVGLGFLTAILFSAFIYFEEYNLTNNLVNTISGVLALGMFLYIPKKSIPVAGFLIGLFWFYWIGYSFEYQGVGYMTPFITIAFGFIYLLFFLPLYFTQKAWIRAILLFGLSFVEPFDWNWLQIELLFVNSYIGVYKYQLILVLMALALPSLLKGKFKYLPFVLLLGAINYGYPKQEDAPLKIKLVQTEVKQEDKWKRKNRRATLSMLYHDIQNAIKDGYDVIVLPESVFPFFMNRHPIVMKKLLDYSKDISIVTGSLLLEGSKHYNATYLFQDGKMSTAKKLVLVPFGEYIPLPKFAVKFINETFFAGGSDFLTAKKPTDFDIKGVKFRNAICYEATCQELYDGDVKYMVAISNNAWFAPSIEVTLQKLLMEYYARKNGVTIYHSANYKGTGIIK